MKGRMLAEKYRLVDELGRGGMGSVWRAEHVELRSPVAVKLIDPTLAETREGQSRFLREARAASALRSNHVVSVFDYGVDQGTPFLVMELLEGESLAQRMEKRGRLTLAEVQAIMKQVARGLVKAHTAGIVHRDLKPENIFITAEADSELVKVLDFGIAKVTTSMAVSVQTQTGMVLGTPYYMSPEQAEGRRELDARSDIWSLGVIVYECILGKRPFDGDNLAQIILAICADPLPVPSQAGPVPAGFDEWFARVASRRLETRCPTVGEFAEELSRLGDIAPEAAVVPQRHAATPQTRPGGTGLVREPAEVAVQGDRSAGEGGAVRAHPASFESSAERGDPGARGAFVTSDVFANSSPEWSKPEAPPVSAQSGAHPINPANKSPSLLAQGVVAVLVVAAAALLGVGGWYWSGGGTLTDVYAVEASGVNEVPEITPVGAAPLGSEVRASATAGASPAASPARETHQAPEVSSASPVLLDVQAAKQNTPPAAPITTSVTPTPVPPAFSGARPGPVVAPAKGGSGSAKSPTDALYCIHHAISGRLVRSSPGKAGSFACYMHALSGELRKKE